MKINAFLVSAPLTVLLLASCGSANKGKQVQKIDSQQVVPRDSLVFISSKDGMLNGSCNDTAKGQMPCCPQDSKAGNFAFDLFGRIASGSKDNFVLSPLSLSLALGMTAEGADGQTLDEMISVLGVKPLSCCEGEADLRKLVGKYYASLTKTLSEADTSVAMESANSIWVDKSISLKQDFVEQVHSDFDAEVSSIDFTSPSAKGQINSWCSEKTHGKIPSIVDNTRSWKTALVNAVYFKAAWTEPFERTVKAQFTSSAGTSKPETFLRKKDILNYSENEEFQMVELPYGERGRFVMDVVLPKDSTDFTPSICPMCFKELTDSLAYRHVNFRMPQFKIESKAELVPILNALGMGKAFTDAAEFPFISDAPLMIDNVLQKAYIDVNKDGTEAAAVTVVSMRLTSVGPGFEPEYIDFIANRPFIFLIRETASGEILFIGRKSE